jgi:chemotaxis protein CheX
MSQAVAAMNVAHINPFVESLVHVFQTMLSLTPRRKGLQLARGERVGSGLTTLVGISGSVHGVVVLHFKPETAIKLASRFLGASLTEMSADVVDAMSELTNMVAGAAKAKIPSDPPAELSLPSVVEGTQYRLKYPSKSLWVEVPFETEDGNFMLEVSFSNEG